MRSWSCCSVTLTIFSTKLIWICWWISFWWPSFKGDSSACDRKVDDRQILWSMILIGNFVIVLDLDQSVMTSIFIAVNRFQLQEQIKNIFETIASWQIADWNTDFTALRNLVQYGNCYKWGQRGSISSVHLSKLFKYEVKWWKKVGFNFSWSIKSVTDIVYII